MKTRNRILLVVAITLLIGIGWLGISSYHAATQARLALADLNRLQVLANRPSLTAFPELQATLAALEAHLRGTQQAARPFLWLAPHLGWVPKYGTTIAALPALLDMAIQVAVAGHKATDALAPATDVIQAGAGLDRLPELVAALQAASAQLNEAELRLIAAEMTRQTIRGPLHPRLEAQLARLDRLLPLARTALTLTRLAPGLLGAEGPRTYLILAQNNHEIRATGGFISGAGYITLDRGRIVQLKMADSYAADNWTQPHPAPPLPLTEQMGLQLWTVRDANWSPDFMEAGEVARALYAQDQGVFTNGAFAFDLEAARLLVGVVGPLQIEGIDEPITAANTIQWMKEAWQSPTATEESIASPQRREWFRSRKDFMGELIAAAFARLQSGADLDVLALGQTVLTLLERRHIQISVDDPEAAALLAQHGWDGGLRPPAGSDFLAVIDSNVGFNKVNAVVKPALAYRVETTGAGLEATLAISYTHTAPAGSEPVCERSPRYGDSYDEMTRRCYWNYLRVYTPGGSELLAAEGFKKTTAEPGERGTTVFAGDFVVQPGTVYTVTLRYRLPAELPAAPYRLFVRKQGGTVAIPLVVEALGCRWKTDLQMDRALACER